MKRFFAILILAVGMIPLSAIAESSHSGGGSAFGSKRTYADPNRRDFSSRAYSIAGQCDTTRPGGDSGAIPAGPEGTSASAADGASLHILKNCTGCHGKKSAASFSALINGTKTPPDPMGQIIAGLTESEKQAILAYLSQP